MKRVSTGWIAAWLCCVYLPVAGEEADRGGAETVMPPMVVTATRDARLLKNAPYAGDVLTGQKVQLEKMARTVPEALKYEPSTLIQKTAHGQGSPYIRGFTSQRNLFMIDGVRLNNSVFREGPNQYWNTVDALSLSRIEIVRGPFSMLYGSDAVGGTIHAITRGARDLRPGSDWDRRLYYRVSDAENSHMGRVESIGKLNDEWTVTLGYTYKHFGDLEAGGDIGTQEKTGYLERDWDGKLEYALDESATLVLAHQHVGIDDAWRTHKTIYGIDWEGLSVGKELSRILDQERELTYLQYHDVEADGIAQEIHVGVSHQLQAEERYRSRTEDRYDRQGFDCHTLGSFVSLKSMSPVGTLIYGAEYYHDDVESFNHKLDAAGTVTEKSIQGPVGDDATYDLLGVYLQDEIPVGDRMSLILGGRYEYAEAHADAVEDPETGDRISVSGDWDHLIGSARLLCPLDDERTWNLFAGVSQGFRAPNLSDLTRLDTARTDEIETPSPDLEPEEFASCELGIKAATAGLGVQLAYYYTDIDGMIIRTPTGRVIDENVEVTKKNGGDGYVHGVELDGQACLSADWTLYGVFTWMEGKVETYPTSEAEMVEEYIDRLMPPTGRLGLRWQASPRYWAEVECEAATEADRLSTRDESDTSRIPPGGTPGYAVCHARVGVRCPKGPALTLAVENITDEAYRIHGSGLNEPGRNLILAADWTF